MHSCLLLLMLAGCILGTWCCEPSEYRNGCKITDEGTCFCGYGCRSQYIYRTRRLCTNAIKVLEASSQRPPDNCSNAPCLRGYCLQTSNGPGFICKCEGSGFYGRQCERACPVQPSSDMVFPHECVVI